MSDTAATTMPAITASRPGLVSLILALVAGVFLCLSGLSVNPARMLLFSLPSLLTSLGGDQHAVLLVRTGTVKCRCAPGSRGSRSEHPPLVRGGRAVHPAGHLGGGVRLGSLCSRYERWRCIPCRDETEAQQLAERIVQRKQRRGYRWAG